MRPVAGSSFNPRGKILRGKFHRAVAGRGMVNRNGDPGRTPKTFAPLMRGVAGAGGVRM